MFSLMNFVYVHTHTPCPIKIQQTILFYLSSKFLMPHLQSVPFSLYAAMCILLARCMTATGQDGSLSKGTCHQA